MNILVLTVSDRLFELFQELNGEERETKELLASDKAGNTVQELVENNFKGCAVKRRIVSDDKKRLEEELLLGSIGDSSTRMNLILTCGGTGFGVRDSTPEAIRNVIEKEATGLSIAMMTASLQKTPMAALSRPVCGVRGNTLIISLPGSSKGARENLESIISVLPHALDLVRGERGAGEALHSTLNGPHPATTYIAKQQQRAPVIHNCVHHRDVDASPSKQVHDGSAKSNDPSQSVTKRARSSPYPMISYHEALSLVMDYSTVHVNDTISKSISDPSLIGCVLAQDVISKESVPSYRASVVDGYAVHHTNGPDVYSVQTNNSVAGSATPLLKLEPGCIARITTGAPVPDGATAVVMVEDTVLVETSSDGLVEVRVEIRSSVVENENIRPIGCDVAVGERVLTKGQEISSVGGEIGVLASIGQANVQVYRKPRVAILSTGNELKEASFEGPIPYGAIRDSNRPALAQIIQANGYEIIDLGVAGDSVESLEMSLKGGLEQADVVLTTGGVSMGELDLLKPVIERRLNGTIHFGRVALKPGKPTTFATISHPSSNEQKLLFALPGNPVSALVTFQLFVLPVLRNKSGLQNPHHMRLKVKLSHDIKLDPRPEFYRVTLSNIGEAHWIATGTGIQQSSRVMSMASASALLQLPPRDQNRDPILKAESLVDCILL